MVREISSNIADHYKTTNILNFAGGACLQKFMPSKNQKTMQHWIFALFDKFFAAKFTVLYKFVKFHLTKFRVVQYIHPSSTIITSRRTNIIVIIFLFCKNVFMLIGQSCDTVDSLLPLPYEGWQVLQKIDHVYQQCWEFSVWYSLLSIIIRNDRWKKKSLFFNSLKSTL